MPEAIAPSGSLTDAMAQVEQVDEAGRTRGDTCHIDVVDRWGNLVSATPSGGWLQSNPTIPELGFCLGTRAQMFWLGPACRRASPPTSVRAPRWARWEPGRAAGDVESEQAAKQDQWQLRLLLSTD